VADHFSCKSSLSHKRDHRLSVQRKWRRPVLAQTIEIVIEKNALPSPALPTCLTFAAPVIGCDDVGTRLQGFDPHPDALDNTAGFMSQHHRVRVVLLNPYIRMADSTSDGLYQRLVRTRVFKVEFLDDEFFVSSKVYDSLYFHIDPLYFLHTIKPENGSL
jgi:hypothetical protein